MDMLWLTSTRERYLNRAILSIKFYMGANVVLAHFHIATMLAIFLQWTGLIPSTLPLPNSIKGKCNFSRKASKISPQIVGARKHVTLTLLMEELTVIQIWPSKNQRKP